MHSKWKQLALAQQGLLTTPKFDHGIQGTHQAIEHLGYVQIDTLSVVERAHHHVLWNRVPDYKNEYLNQLVQACKIFEYWFHAAAYLPMCDYRYALPRMQSIRDGENRYFGRGDATLMREILKRVQAEGGIKLRQLDQKKTAEKAGWWNFGPARRSIEQLYMQGDLMIVERHGMEKVFDLTERMLPSKLDLTMPTFYEQALYLFNTTLRAHGIFTWKQLVHLRQGKAIREAMRQVILEHLDAGIITEQSSHQNQQNHKGEVFYIHVEQLELLPRVSKGLKILSPFDNLMIHRDRLNALFNYDFKIECYVPASKRVYGYFCLPILYGDQLVARMDCKAHRKIQTLEVINLYFENDKIFDRTAFLTLLNIELEKFAHFNGCCLANDRLTNF